uniref:DUF3226 domain-containing protein n=1 Tax=Herbaspirillum aquaticum TaxID=568783 RepID=UPI0024DEE46D
MAKPIYFDAKIDGNRQDRPFLIFVEGVDDGHFVDVLLDDLNVSVDDVGIVIVGGKDKFEKAISQAKKTHSFRQMRGLALLRDADEDFQVAANEVDRIFQAHFNITIPHGKTGIADGRKIGAYIFPGENEPGDLEKACLSTVQGTQIEVLAESFMENAQGNADSLNQPFKRKAQVYCKREFRHTYSGWLKG